MGKGETNPGFVTQDDPDLSSEDHDKFEEILENNNAPSRIKKTSATSVTSISSTESLSTSNGDGNGKFKKTPRGSSASETENSTGITIGRRRSSAEIIRQSRAFKRLSKAFSSIGFLPEITEYQLVGITEEEVLAKLFEVFDYHQERKLNQDQWIELLKSRLNQFDNESTNSQLEQRQVDFVEVVESVAYAVCGEADINFEDFCKIFRTKNVLNAFFCLIDRDLDGIVTVEQIMEFISKLSSARSGSRLTKENISWLEDLFRQYVGDTKKEIRKEDFSKIIQTKNQFFTDRVFDIYDGDASGSISLQEFLDAMHKFTGENPEDKIKFLFRVYDVDGDGLIQEKELEQVMRACMEENGMNFSDHQISELTTALFEDADVEGRGALTYEALKGQLEKHPGLLENLSISIERWLVPVKPKDPPKKMSLLKKLRSLKPHQFTTLYLKNNYVYVVWLVAFLVTNAALFLSRALSYRGTNANLALILAKAAGQCLNFNCTFIVVVMLRQSLTFLRSRGASAYMPIDQHIYFHKMTGWFIFLFSVFHTVMHLWNIEIGLVHNTNFNNTGNWTYADFLVNPEATKGLKFGLIPGCANLTGVTLMIILTLMVICSLPFVRRGGCFEVFYWTHLLYTAFWLILIFHAPNFWKWFIVPGIIFIVEQALRVYHWRIGRGKTYISSGILLPSKVTHLIIKRPQTFDFHPGDYVFVRIPEIAKYEWHPFTISSGPEQTDAMWLHIRAVGQWTNRLYEYFEQEQTNMSGNFVDLLPKKDAFTKGDKFTRQGSCVQKEPMKQNILTADPKTRPQFKSVGDSYVTLIPDSDHSSVASESSNDLSSSRDEVMDLDAVIREKKLPILTRKHPLKSTKSTPDVYERMTERERNLNLRQLFRSESVRSEMPTVKTSPSQTTSGSPFIGSSRDSSAALSLRYMRNKPKIIPLQTPNQEADDKEARVSLIGRRRSRTNSNCREILAEEGRGGLQGDKNGVSRQESTACFELATTRMSRERLSVGKALEIYVDGPYGAPSSHIFRAQHAVLIGTGIGVTPFASILQSIMRRYWASRNTCPNCNYTWGSDLPLSVLNLQKVDFFWINRDQRSFEWFVHLLSQLEIEQAELGGAMERFLDMHMYITSALKRTDMKAVGLQLALDLLHEKEKRDLITGLKTRTNAGRPNWDKIFKQLQDQAKGKVTVFYCGPPTLARTLKIKCDEFGFSFRKELF